MISALVARDRPGRWPGGIEEAVDVFLELEHASVVEADALEHAVAVEQAVVEHADFGVGFVAEFAVEVDFHRGGSGEVEKADKQGSDRRMQIKQQNALVRHFRLPPSAFRLLQQPVAHLQGTVPARGQAQVVGDDQ